MSEYQQLQARRDQFIANCEAIVQSLGDEIEGSIALGIHGPGRRYNDGVVEIATGVSQTNPAKTYLEIVRLENNNPVVYRISDEVIRHHGEFSHIEQHVTDLAGTL